MAKKEKIPMGIEEYNFEDFVKIIERLRAKDGCPWDREQTHDSLRSCMMEEAAEFVNSIRIYRESGSAENMREELGDLLLQVVMHSVIAEEEGLFTLDDVIETVSEKMIRRHPHIFGTVQVDSAAQVLQNWEEIKKKEKEGKAQTVPPSWERPKWLGKALLALCEMAGNKDIAIGEAFKDKLEQLIEETERKQIKADEKGEA